MALIGTILWWALQLYFFALLGRFVIDLLISFKPGWRPQSAVLPLVEVVLTITDPPLKFVRRFIPPLRLGAVALDFGWTIVVIAVFFLQRLVLIIT